HVRRRRRHGPRRHPPWPSRALARPSRARALHRRQRALRHRQRRTPTVIDPTPHRARAGARPWLAHRSKLRFPAVDFELTEAQRLIVATAREFTERRIRPLAAEIDREERFPAELVLGLAELGMMGVNVPA